jgi:DUF971 family protein
MTDHAQSTSSEVISTYPSGQVGNSPSVHAKSLQMTGDYPIRMLYDDVMKRE